MTTLRSCGVPIPRILIKASAPFLFGAAFVVLVSGVSHVALAQSSRVEKTPDFAPAMIEHMQKMRKFKDHDQGAQATPSIIPQFSKDPDSTGIVATFQPNGRTFTSNNAFFQDLGTNGRTCLTCHQPQEGWGISAEGVQHRFADSQGKDPIFRLVDGAVCPSANVSTLDAKRKAYKLLVEKGLIRVGLAIPANTEYEVVAVDDPYGCNSNPETGLQGPFPTKTGIISIYRRPLPTTNLKFDSTMMWDGREPRPDSPELLRASLAQQALDATLGHAQADHPLTDEQRQQIVDFELGLFTAQEFDNKAKSLTDSNARGGPVNLAMTDFYVGINDPLGQNPKNIPFTLDVFDLYRPWLGSTSNNGGGDLSAELQKIGLAERSHVAEYRQSVARGEQLFNGKAADGSPKGINITGVGGLNDALHVDSIPGGCGTCHDTPNVGNHSVTAPLNIGITNAGDLTPPAVDIAGLPVFTLRCVSGALADPNKLYKVTDLGRALISGLCKDIGKTKGPILRGLASRAPYFHNGSAKNLRDAVNFYDQRFNIGYSEQQKTDLVNFLNTL